MTTQAIQPLSRSLQPARPDWIPERLFPYQSHYCRLGEARLHYIDEGSGPTVLMLHGSPMWSFMYRDLIAALRVTHRCIAVDLPGMGLSAAPIVTGRAFQTNADLLSRFVEALGLRKVTLVVHATAGPSALAMASRMPERFERLVISNSFAWSLRDDPKLRRIVRVVSSRLFGALVVHFNLLARITARAGRRSGRFDAAERAAILGPYRDKQARRHLRNILLSVRRESPWLDELEPGLATIRDRPVLFVYGAKDNGYQAGFLTRWQRLLPNHQTMVLENAGHFPLEDDPKGFVGAVGEWLR